MKCIVTGGCGFIGSHLVDRLIKEKNDVIVIDDLSTGKIENTNSDAKYVCESLQELKIKDSKYESLFKNVDTIFHLAASKSVIESLEKPERYLDNNIMSTLKVLDLCVKYKIKKLVFASSASVYGNAQCPTLEDSELLPISPYAISKLSCEAICFYYHFRFDLSVGVVRFFNVYGERMTTNAISIFINNIIEKKKSFINGEGVERDYIYIDDLISLLISVSDDKEIGVYNGGTGIGTSTLSLYNIIKEKMNSKIKPIIREEIFEPKKNCADISKAREKFAWFPMISLSDGLDITIKKSVKK